MTQVATFKWRDMYFNYLREMDPSLTDPGLPSVRVRRDYGLLTIHETKVLDPRETLGKREFVKAIFKSDKGIAVITTYEGQINGAIHYFT